MYLMSQVIIQNRFIPSLSNIPEWFHPFIPTLVLLLPALMPDLFFLTLT